MRRSVLVMLLCLFCALCFAQDIPEEGPENPETQPEAPFKKTEAISRSGDQLVQLGIMVDIPFVPKKLKVGGAGSLSYAYYFSRWFSLGGSVGFAYSSTLGSNVYYFVPITVKPSFHIQVGRFEFPLSLGIGGTFQAYIDRNYFGFYVRPEIAGFYRFLPNWSIGVVTGLSILPQWYKNSDYNRVGLVMDVGVSARYHF